MSDYYQILGVSKTSSIEDIKKAYRKLAMKYHPDRNSDNPEAENMFREITKAYAVLGDEDNRKIYDQEVSKSKSTSSASNNRTNNKNNNIYKKQGFNFEDVEQSFENFFGFNPKTNENIKKEKMRNNNPLDASNAFEIYFGFKPKKK